MVTGDLGTKLIEEFEQINDNDNSRIGFQPKPDCGGNYTAGIGHMVIDPLTNKTITIDTPNGYERACELYKDLTIDQAYSLLKEDLKKQESIVNKKIKVNLLQNEYDALVSYVFNTGGSTTLFSLINSAPLTSQIIRDWWLNHYIISGGVIRNGLIRRRKSEYNLFLTGKLNFFE